MFQLSNHFIPCLSYCGLMSSVMTKQLKLDHLSAMKLREIIVETREKKLPDPNVTGNAGSFFMNPIVDVDVFHQILYDRLIHGERPAFTQWRKILVVIGVIEFIAKAVEHNLAIHGECIA